MARRSIRSPISPGKAGAYRKREESVMTTCALAAFVSRVIEIYLGLMLVYAVVSWLPGLRGRWTEYLARIIEPLLLPIRQVIPSIAGLDLSFLVLFFVLQLIQRVIVPPQCFYV